MQKGVSFSRFFVMTPFREMDAGVVVGWCLTGRGECTAVLVLCKDALLHPYKPVY